MGGGEGDLRGRHGRRPLGGGRGVDGEVGSRAEFGEDALVGRFEPELACAGSKRVISGAGLEPDVFDPSLGGLIEDGHSDFGSHDEIEDVHLAGDVRQRSKARDSVDLVRRRADSFKSQPCDPASFRAVYEDA